MPKMPIWSPFGKFNLRDELGLEPYAVFHFFPRQSPLRALLFREIDERSLLDLKPFDRLEYLPTNPRHKAVSNLRCIVKFALLIISNDERVKRITRV